MSQATETRVAPPVVAKVPALRHIYRPRAVVGAVALCGHVKRSGGGVPRGSLGQADLCVVCLSLSEGVGP